MDRLLKAARAAGSTIIHAPSGTMDTYEGTPARVRAQQAPEAASYPAGIDEWQYNSAREPRGTGSGPRDAQGPNAEGEGVQDNGYPIDQRDGGEDDDATEHAAWARALAAEGINPGAPWTGYGQATTPRRNSSTLAWIRQAFEGHAAHVSHSRIDCTSALLTRGGSVGVQSDGGADDRRGAGLRLGQRLGGVEHHGEQVYQERPAHGRPHVRLTPHLL